jgi:penicillin-binding protein 2
VANYFGDSLRGAAVALEPTTGAVLALHSAPGFDPNRFIGTLPRDYYTSLIDDPRRPLYNKATQGLYPPGSTFKLATAVIALETGAATLDDRMPQPCTGGYYYGSRYFRCWEHSGHGFLTMAQAIAKSCDVYFYQLGLKLTLTNLLAGGVKLKFGDRSGIDLPVENKPAWPYAVEYFNHKYGPTGWSNAVTLNLAIGQGENSQTLVNMARFYTALATDGRAATPNIARPLVQRTKIFDLTPAQLDGLRAAMANVVTAQGTAASAAIRGVEVAGKTGSAQNGKATDAWFVGFAPREDPKVVVAVLLVGGEHGYLAARVASKIIEHYLKQPTAEIPRVEGDD